MQELECSECSQERRRRCRVITGNQNKDAHCSQKFSQAPYIHPFNQPKYQAQLTHAIVFAKSVRSKILGYLAEDWLQDSGAVASKEELCKKRETWLELHDKQTAGILGLLPLVRNMPVRFTETYNRELGAYKHATGKLIGWSISVTELARLDTDPDPEMVLRECPTFLRVKLTHPTKLAPNGLVDVRPCTRPWRRGSLQIYRRGFQLGPDFAGTAHAYCGSTLQACKGDLLHWTAQPTADSRLRAYIIRSRVRAADDILIVQPYSPCLFRQALAIGPRLLLQRQAGEISLDAAAEAWAGEQRNSTSAAAKHQQKAPSWTTWTVPCRTCSDEAGKEVRWPLRCFLLNLTQHAAWMHITRGQLLQCRKCQHFRAPTKDSALLMCELCEDLVRRGRFDAVATKWWDECVPGARIQCKLHPAVASSELNCERSAEKEACPAPTYFCSGCKVTWPEAHFPVEELKLNEEMDLVTLHCWRCHLKALHPETFAKRNDLQCKTCKNHGLTLDHFPPSITREILQVGVRAKRRESRKGTLLISCTDCVFPKCLTHCGQRSPTAMIGPLHKRRVWFCDACRLKEYACSECCAQWPFAFFEANAWSVGDKKLIPKGHCFSCHLRLREPKVWKKWTNFTCSTCLTTGLTLEHFEPSLAKEVFERRSLDWSKQQRTCLSCVEKSTAISKRCTSSTAQRPCKRLKGDQRKPDDGADAGVTSQQTSSAFAALADISTSQNSQTGDQSQVTCHCCKRSGLRPDFNQSRTPLCWICHWEKTAPEKFRAWNDLKCQSCKRTQLSLKAFPPRVSNELLRQTSGKRQKQINVKVSCADCCYPLCWMGCGTRASVQRRVFEEQQRPWFCTTCQTSFQTCWQCGAAWQCDRFVLDSLRGIDQQENAKPTCYTCALLADKPVYDRWQALSRETRWQPLRCTTCTRNGLSITDFDPLVAKDILQQGGFKCNQKKFRVCRQCAPPRNGV